VPESVLIIACGALATEIDQLKKSNGWQHLDLACLDAKLHHRPERIPERLRGGTRGEIDRVIAEEGGDIERLPGVHCYQFFAGSERFAELADAEPGTFYLTDFLAKHFDKFVMEPLKLDTRPELRDAYFGNYQRVVFLSQTEDESLLRAAQDAAKRLELDFEHVHCGYGELETSIRGVAVRAAVG
jgi:hypothetical protein